MDPNKQHFYDCAGRLGDLPSEYKKWRTLNEYRTDWDFLPLSLRHRVAEQCMASDYIVSIDAWLHPGLTIRDKQKVVLIQILSSIYEGVLSELLSSKIKVMRAGDPFFDKVFNDALYGEKRTLGPVVTASLSANFIDSRWNNYFGYVREIRNWVHLTNESTGPLLQWLQRQSCVDLRDKLDEFRVFIRPKF